jgi:hypothetical protein
MAKQPSKSARDDSSAGGGAAAVSSHTDTVAAAVPLPALPSSLGAGGIWSSGTGPVGAEVAAVLAYRGNSLLVEFEPASVDPGRTKNLSSACQIVLDNCGAGACGYALAGTFNASFALPDVDVTSGGGDLTSGALNGGKIVDATAGIGLTSWLSGGGSSVPAGASGSANPPSWKRLRPPRSCHSHGDAEPVATHVIW